MISQPQITDKCDQVFQLIQQIAIDPAEAATIAAACLLAFCESDEVAFAVLNSMAQK